MEFFLISILVPLLVSIYCLFKIRKTETRKTVLQTPPGSTGLPIIGETLSFHVTGKNGVPERFVLDRIKKYSSKVFKTSLLGHSMAILCGAEGNKFLFSNENKLVKFWLPRSVDQILGSFSMDTDGSMASLHARKSISPFIKPDSLKMLVPIMDSATKQHLQTHWEGRDVITVFPLVKGHAFSLACRLFLGIDEEDDQETITRLHKLFNNLLSGVFSLPINLPGTNYRRGIKAMGKLKEEIDMLVKQRRSDFSEGRMSSKSQQLLSKILTDVFENDDDIFTSILALILGSYDNVSSALATITMYLAQLPHVYETVLTEQREIAESKGPLDMLNWGDLQKMKYSWNVACEALRMHPPSSGTFREALSDFEYGGFLIPKGMKLHWNAYATHKNPKYFKNPDRFEPSRFEGDGPVPYSFVPFGGGPRMCPGVEYAKTIILVFMHNLVTKFKWNKVFPDEKIICDPLIKPAKDLQIHLYSHKF